MDYTAHESAGLGAKMTKNRFKWSAITAAFVAASLASGLALAVDENESYYSGNCDNTISQARPLEFDASGVAVVNGTMLNGSGSTNNFCNLAKDQNRDIDFYSFHANAGDVLDIGISNAWNGTYTWTVLGVYGPPDSTGHYPLLRQVNYVLNPDGTVNFNPYVENGFAANADGTYYVGVSSQPNTFNGSDGQVILFGMVFSSSPIEGTPGSYTLTVKGAKPPVLQISIDVKPSDNHTTVLDARSVAHPAAMRVLKGHLPVALLSSEKDNFKPMEVDQSTLRFGSTGKEESLVSCNGGHGTDVNNDGIPDLICHFDLKKANFALSESEGTITGKTGDGRDFEGKGWLKTVTIGLTPEKMGYGHKK